MSILGPYRIVLSDAYRWDRYLLLVKTLSLVVGVLLVALAVYWTMWLLIAALIVALAGWFSEVVIREVQKPKLVALAEIERRLDLPHIYLKIKRNVFTDFYLLFPHVAIIGLVIITAGLWLAGKLPFH